MIETRHGPALEKKSFMKKRIDFASRMKNFQGDLTIQLDVMSLEHGAQASTPEHP